MKYAAMLRHERESYGGVGISQVELAKRAGIDRPYLQKVEAGACKPHVAKQVRRIERALGIKDKRLLIASMVDRAEIDVSHMTRAARERFARVALGIADPPVASAEWPTLDRREAEEIETSDTMRYPGGNMPDPQTLMLDAVAMSERASPRRKEPREGTLNARVLSVLRSFPDWKDAPKGLGVYQVLKELSSETADRVSNALSSLRTAGWAKSEPGRNGRERLWSLA